MISCHGKTMTIVMCTELYRYLFNMYQILDDNYYNEKYLIQTRSQTKSSGTKLPEAHGVRKNLYPNLKPEKQHAMPKMELWKGCT